MGIPLAVTALIFSDRGRVLSVSRKDDYEDFNLPGGKIDPGETPHQAVMRELREETGLLLSNLSHCFVRKTEDGYICITFLYEGTIEEDSVVLGLREGEAVVAWKTWEDITSDNTFSKYNQTLREFVEKNNVSNSDES